MSIAQARLTRESQSKKLRHTVTVRGHVIGFLRFNNESDSILATVGNNSTSVFMWLMRFGFFTLVGHLQISVSRPFFVLFFLKESWI